MSSNNDIERVEKKIAESHEALDRSIKELSERMDSTWGEMERRISEEQNIDTRYQKEMDSLMEDANSEVSRAKHVSFVILAYRILAALLLFYIAVQVTN